MKIIMQMMIQILVKLEYQILRHAKQNFFFIAII